MRDLPFIKQNHHDRKINNSKSGNRKDGTPKINPAIQQLFKNSNIFENNIFTNCKNNC